MTMKSELKILVLGATGLLGGSLGLRLKESYPNVICHGHTNMADVNLDLMVAGNVSSLLSELNPDVVVNLIGLTSVERCQEESNLAYLLNTKIVEDIVLWVNTFKPTTYLVQISTDQVYDGQGPHSENDVTLTNIYALTKYAAEISARQIDSAILRTNFVGKSKVKSRESLTDWVYSAVSGNQEVFVLDDIFFSPLSINTLIEIISEVIEKRPLGVFNVGSTDGMSKADFDFLFADLLAMPVENMKKIKSHQATFLRAYRPKDMRMNCDLIQSVLGIKLPKLADEIKKVAYEYDTNS